VHGNGVAAAGRGGKSILSMDQTNERGNPHTTGIHRIVVDRKKGKKVRKKGSTFCISKKARLEGSPKVAPFFQSWNKRALPE
jgi:hypothetical protein